MSPVLHSIISASLKSDLCVECRPNLTSLSTPVFSLLSSGPADSWAGSYQTLVLSLDSLAAIHLHRAAFEVNKPDLLSIQAQRARSLSRHQKQLFLFALGSDSLHVTLKNKNNDGATVISYKVLSGDKTSYA